jgi:hypothetical protein
MDSQQLSRLLFHISTLASVSHKAPLLSVTLSDKLLMLHRSFISKFGSDVVENGNNVKRVSMDYSTEDPYPEAVSKQLDLLDLNESDNSQPSYNYNTGNQFQNTTQFNQSQSGANGFDANSHYQPSFGSFAASAQFGHQSIGQNADKFSTQYQAPLGTSSVSTNYNQQPKGDLLADLFGDSAPPTSHNYAQNKPTDPFDSFPAPVSNNSMGQPQKFNNFETMASENSAMQLKVATPQTFYGGGNMNSNAPSSQNPVSHTLKTNPLMHILKPTSSITGISYIYFS